MSTSNRPTCSYCDAVGNLRVVSGGPYEAPDYICRACFRARDDGPSFDDLPEVRVRTVLVFEGEEFEFKPVDAA